MKIITYSLRSSEHCACEYYHTIAGFSDEVIAQGEYILNEAINSFQQWCKEHRNQRNTSRPEILYELLMLGVLWNERVRASQNLHSTLSNLLSALVRIRKNSSFLKPAADRLRGTLSGFLLVKSPQGEPEVKFSLNHFARLIDWLEASGEYEQQAEKLHDWYQFFSSTSDTNIFVKIQEFTAWFSRRSTEVLARYTPNVDSFLDSSRRRYLLREDRIFCLRGPIEYFLNMVGNEILNREYRAGFLSAEKKLVILPPCMCFQPEGKCQARETAQGSLCMHCTPGCRVHQISLLGEKYGFGVVIMPDELQVLSTGAPDKQRSPLGVVGVSCVLTNAPGGWRAERLGIPAQGVMLDYCGCSYHWDKQGFPTDIDLHKLLEVLGVAS